MNTKEQIIREIDSLSESQLQKILELIQLLKLQPEAKKQSKAVEAFLDSLKERQEVYRRLADS
jgi:hypothetical protein